MRPVDKGPPPLLSGNEDDAYDVMRQRLLERIGSWCSYCEAPITNDVAVEHKVAKEGFSPEVANAWQNLLLACQACNSAKGAHPASSDAPTFAQVMGLWIWPDGDPTQSLLTYDYSSRTQKELVEAGIARAPGSPKDTDPWYTTAATCVWVIPNAATIGTDVALQTRVKAAIKGLNLNYYNPWDPGYSDRRVDNRTYAWTLAQSCAGDLASTYTKKGFDLVVASIRSTALAVGFWSTWFTALRAALSTNAPPWGDGKTWNVSAAIRGDILSRILVQYAPDPLAPGKMKTVFPGTGITRVNTTLT